LITNASLCAIGHGSTVSAGLIAGVTVGAAVIAAAAIALAAFLIIRALQNQGAPQQVAGNSDLAQSFAGHNPLFQEHLSSTNPLA